MPTMGDTINLRVTFRDNTGTLIDPTTITLSVYSSTYDVIEEDIDIPLENRQSAGVYDYQYTLPFRRAESVELIFRFVGVYQDNPIVVGKEVTVFFV
jgi:hypothetical protein